MRVTVTAVTLRGFLDAGWKQPDARSCGAAVLVAAEAVRNDAYARWLVDGGRSRHVGEVLAMHRRVTGVVDVHGRLQAPWPRALGTPPWAVLNQLAGRTGKPHRRVRGKRALLWDRITASSLAGDPVALYLGSRTLPRHVVLVVPVHVATAPVDDTLVIHDPAYGRLRTLTRADFVAGRLAPGWPQPWWAVLPVRPGSSDVRTPA